MGDINKYAYVENDPIDYIDPYGLVKGIHFDYTAEGQRLIHYGAYRYNSDGQLVTHRGQIIKNVPREAARTLDWLQRVKQGFFKKPGGSCPVGSGAKGPKGGGTTLGVLSLISQIIGFIDAENRAKENGVTVWDQMMLDFYEGAGYTIIYPKDQVM